MVDIEKPSSDNRCGTSARFQIRGERILVVASTGGHLEQAISWANYWAAKSQIVTRFCTFENSQSKSLLQGADVSFYRYMGPRQWRLLPIQTVAFIKEIRRFRPERVVSTGAGFAIPAFLAASLMRVPCTYIESMARVESRSMTGKIVDRVPWVEKLVQHPLLATNSWLYAGSILDDYRVHPCEFRSSRPMKIFVSVGTIRPYSFDRLIKDAEAVAEPGDHIVYQTGTSRYEPKNGQAYPEMAKAELEEEIRSADVVLTHAGVGSILTTIRCGKVPVVVARQSQLEEHIDDHQQQILRHVVDRGLAIEGSPKGICRADLLAAARLRVDPATKSQD